MMKKNISFLLFLVFLCMPACGMERPSGLIIERLQSICCDNVSRYISSTKNVKRVLDIFSKCFVDEDKIPLNHSCEELLFFEHINIMRTLLQLNSKFFKEINSSYKNSIIQYNCHIDYFIFSSNFVPHFDSIYKKACNGSSIDNFYIELIAKDIATKNNNILELISSHYAKSNLITKLYGPSSFNIIKKRLLEKKIKKDTCPLVYLLNRILYFKNSKQIVLQSANQIMLPSYLQSISRTHDIDISNNILVIDKGKTQYTIVIQKIDTCDDFGINPTVCTIL